MGLLTSLFSESPLRRLAAVLIGDYGGLSSIHILKQNISRSHLDSRDILLLNNEPFPFPQNPPYFEENGVCFLYQQYEIAPYAAGMPACVIPFETLRPYFTDDVLQMLGLD